MQLQQRMDVDPHANAAATHHPVKPALKKARTSNRVFGQDLTNQSRQGGSANQQRGGKPALKKQKTHDDLVQKKQKQTTIAVVVDEDDDVVLEDKSGQSEEDEIKEEPLTMLRAWDIEDFEDDLCVADYITDIMAALKSQEMCEDLFLGDTDFMKEQADVNANMRTVLVDWLVEVHRKFKLVPATYFLAINILDRFLSKTQIGRKQLQLCGCACLWISSKYHEIYSPEMDDFVYISDRAFTDTQIIAMEVEILKSVNFVLTVPTLLHYTERYSRISAHYLKKVREKKIIKHLILYCAEHCVVDYKLCRRPPSLLGAACFVFACVSTKVFTIAQYENDNLSEVTGYTLRELNATMRLINLTVQKVDGRRATSVVKKYCHQKYSSIGKLNFAKLKTAFLDSPKKSVKKSVTGTGTGKDRKVKGKGLKEQK